MLIGMSFALPLQLPSFFPGDCVLATTNIGISVLNLAYIYYYFLTHAIDPANNGEWLSNFKSEFYLTEQMGYKLAMYAAINMLSIALEAPYSFDMCFRFINPNESEFTGLAKPLH